MCAICLLNVHESQWKSCLQPDDRYFTSSPLPLHHNQKDLDTHPVPIVRSLCRKVFKLARHSSANLLLVHFESVAVVHIELPRITRQLPCSVCGKNYSKLWHKATPQAVEETFCNCLIAILLSFERKKKHAGGLQRKPQQHTPYGIRQQTHRLRTITWLNTSAIE